MCPSKYHLKKHKKHGSKDLSRVITWLGYKRNVICGIIEIKRPSIEDHSLSTIKTRKFPYHSLQTLGDKQNYPLTLTTYFIFDFSFFFFFFFSSNLHTLMLYFLYNLMLSGYFKIHHDT